MFDDKVNKMYQADVFIFHLYRYFKIKTYFSFQYCSYLNKLWLVLKEFMTCFNPKTNLAQKCPNIYLVLIIYLWDFLGAILNANEIW